EPTAYDPLNPATFVAPKVLNAPSVVIEFCDRVSWMLHRATWTSTELFLTFPPPNINSITLVPLNADETAGRFRVWLAHTGPHGTEEMAMVFDRKVEGRFPEMKELKQRIRDWIQPNKSLGHSD
ncbi:hypothetical protein PENSPDRAFT_547996, partial [Peniophora sp. CONT]